MLFFSLDDVLSVHFWCYSHLTFDYWNVILLSVTFMWSSNGWHLTNEVHIYPHWSHITIPEGSTSDLTLQYQIVQVMVPHHSIRVCNNTSHITIPECVKLWFHITVLDYTISDLTSQYQCVQYLISHHSTRFYTSIPERTESDLTQIFWHCSLVLYCGIRYCNIGDGTPLFVVRDNRLDTLVFCNI